MKDVLGKLAGGDRRSIGKVSEVVSDVMERMEKLSQSGSPARRSWSRKLIARLKARAEEAQRSREP